MPDTYTTRNRFEKMEPGAYEDTWAERANGQFGSDLMDESLDGVNSLTVSGSVSLTANNGATDQARKRILVCTGTGGSIALPSKEKWYIVVNSTSGDVTVGASGSTAVVKSGSTSFVLIDSGNNAHQMLRSDFDAMNILTTGSVSCGDLSTTGSNVLGTGTGDGGDTTTIAGRITLNCTRSDGNLFSAISSSNFGEIEARFTSTSYADLAFIANVARTANSAFDFFRGVSGYGGSADTEFRVIGNGTVASDGGTAMSTPADYADMMEWSDGNPSNEDRVGYSVVLDGGKVRVATVSDDPEDVIGIASGNPSVCGGAGWNRWAGKYLTDSFNRQILTEDGDRVLNPDFDPESEYTPRADRPEWDPIGLCGRLRMRKGCPTHPHWRKMADVDTDIEEWLVR